LCNKICSKKANNIIVFNTNATAKDNWLTPKVTERVARAKERKKCAGG